MKVEATKVGFFGIQRRRPGDQFEIPDEPKGKDGKPLAFSKNWMVEVDPPAPAAQAKPEGGKPKGK